MKETVFSSLNKSLNQIRRQRNKLKSLKKELDKAKELITLKFL